REVMHLISGYEHMISLGFAWLLAALMLLVIVLDVTRYVIPNNLNLAILALYVFAAFLLKLSFFWSLGAAALVLLVGLGIFALGLRGGGDIKLITVLILWTGWSVVTADFIMITAMTGGLLVIVTLTLRAFAPLFYKLAEGKTLPRFLTR